MFDEENNKLAAIPCKTKEERLQAERQREWDVLQRVGGGNGSWP